MLSEREPNNLLVVTASPKLTELLGEILPSRDVGKLCAVSSCAEAKRAMLNAEYDIVVINSPLPDEFGSEFSLEVIKKGAAVAVLFSPRQMFEQVADKVEPEGVLVLPKPLGRETLSAAMRIASAMRRRLRAMERENRSLNAKMAEIRLVNRAKWALIESLGMTEEQAHRHIEKKAMDERISKGDAARAILRTYEK